MEIKFSCTTKELWQVLKLLKAVLPKGAAAKRAILEIEFRNNETDFKIQGATQTIFGKTDGFGKVTVPFLYFMDVIKNVREEIFAPIIREGKMYCGKVTIGVKTDFMAPKATRNIELPINFTSLDSLRLRKLYSEEELRLNKMLTKVQEEETLKKKRIENAYRQLKEYGVSKDELQQLVDITIYGTDAFSL